MHKATKPNQNESFFVSHDRGPEHPDVLAGKPLRGRNQWPPALPEHPRRYDGVFRGARRQCATACCRPLPWRSACRGDFLRRSLPNEAHAVVRFLHYPPQETAEDNTFGQAPHTDNSFMTALARTDVPGLAVRLPSGEWFAPPVIPGTFLINLGNIMRRWSNDRFLSTPHGVLNEFGQGPLLDRLFLQPQPGFGDRVRPLLHQPRQPAALPAGGLPRSGSRILPGQLFPPEGPSLRSRCRSGAPFGVSTRSGRKLTIPGWAIEPWTFRSSFPCSTRSKRSRHCTKLDGRSRPAAAIRRDRLCR